MMGPRPMRLTATIQAVGLLLLTGLLPAEEVVAVDPGTFSNPMIHVEGTRLVDGSGTSIKLRGVLLEGWLMWNGPLWGAGLTSETKIMDRIEDLVGTEEAARFREAVYDRFVSERDIEMIADLGLNVVRVPFNHTVLEKDGALDRLQPLPRPDRRQPGLHLPHLRLLHPRRQGIAPGRPRQAR